MFAPLACVPGGERTFVGSGSGLVVFDANSLDPIATLRGVQLNAFCTAVSPDGLQVATGSRDGTLRFWSARPWSAASPWKR